MASCGLGQNLYVEPLGESFPCYACHQPHSYLGNAIERGLGAILASAAFADLCCHTVDTNAKCRQCDLRYVCGGACRAWGGRAATQRDLDTPPPECKGLQRRAEAVVTEALKYLSIRGQTTRLDCSFVPLAEYGPRSPMPESSMCTSSIVCYAVGAYCSCVSIVVTFKVALEKCVTLYHWNVDYSVREYFWLLIAMTWACS